MNQVKMPPGKPSEEHEKFGKTPSACQLLFEDVAFYLLPSLPSIEKTGASMHVICPLPLATVQKDKIADIDTNKIY